MDDGAIGLGLRELRIRRGWQQQDLGDAAGVSRGTISRIERGHLDDVTLGQVRRTCRALDAYFDQRLRHPELDRLINRGHSAMHQAMALLLDELEGWLFVPEVSFSIYGERGVIDILAFHPGLRIVLVIELKTDIVDVQELIGSLDRKRRLALRIALGRGWQADRVAVWLVIADSRGNRRKLAEHRAVFRAVLPADGREMAAWLRRPGRAIAGLSFLNNARVAGVRTPFARRNRVRRPRSCVRRSPGRAEIAVRGA